MKLPTPGRRTIKSVCYPKCSVRDCPAPGKQRHHVLYKEDHGREVAFPLCDEHHSWITREQSHQTRKQHHPLSEKQRWRNWYRLINGEMKRPRRTKRDVEWEENWALDHGTEEERRAAKVEWICVNAVRGTG